MKESVKTISFETGFDIYKSLEIVFVTQEKYVIQIGSFVLLKDFVLSNFGFVLYKDSEIDSLLKDCFDQREEEYEMVIGLLSDDIISDLTKNVVYYHHKNLYFDMKLNAPYRDILGIKENKRYQ